MAATGSHVAGHTKGLWSKRKHLVPGLVVWVVTEDEAPWPALIKEDNKVPSRTHRIVRLFGERESQGNISIHMQHLEDYSILPRDKNDDDPKLSDACDKAESYVKQHGFSHQRNSLQGERSPMETAALARIYPRKSISNKSNSSIPTPPKRRSKSLPIIQPVLAPRPNNQQTPNAIANTVSNIDPSVCLKLKIKPPPGKRSKQTSTSPPVPSNQTFVPPPPVYTNTRKAPWLSGDVLLFDEDSSSETVAASNTIQNPIGNLRGSKRGKQSPCIPTGRTVKRGVTKTNTTKRRRSAPQLEPARGELAIKRPRAPTNARKKIPGDLAAAALLINDDLFTQFAQKLMDSKQVETLLSAQLGQAAKNREIKRNREAIIAEIESQSRRRDVLKNAVRMVQSVFDDLEADLAEYTRERDAASSELAALRERIERNRKLIGDQKIARSSIAADNVVGKK